MFHFIKKQHVIKLMTIALKLLNGLKRFRNYINDKMKERYNPHRVGLCAALAVLLLWLLMLFVPPYLGVADDGSLYKIMNRAGLSYEQSNTDNNYSNYFVRTYTNNKYNVGKSVIKNSQDIFLQGAIFLDWIFTKDQIFDLRFLGFLYGIIYFPAIYLFTKSVCLRFQNFSEVFAAGLLSVFIFGDVSYITYFNSLYQESVWLICIMYLAGSICILQTRKHSYLVMVLILIAGSVLCTSRQQCGIIGFLLAAFLIKLISFHKKFTWRLLCILLAFVFSLEGVIVIKTMDSDFTITSKYHAMTQGVLFQASNPEKALEEFGINPSYTVLANTSCYNYYPFILADSDELKKGFYDHYTPFDITVYYLKHPYSFIKMLDVAVEYANNLRRSYCGNYEKSAGRPKMGQSIFWAGWSMFKVKNIPQTCGYLLLLNVAAYFLFRKTNKKHKTNSSWQSFSQKESMNNSKLLLYFVLLFTGIGLSQAAITIVMSGASEFTQHAFLLGVVMDIIFYIVFLEIIYQFGILGERADK